MKKFLCFLISALLFTAPVYAEDIKGVEKIGGIEKIGDIHTEEIILEKEPARGVVRNLKSRVSSDYEFYSQLSDCSKIVYDAIDSNILKMQNGTEETELVADIPVETGLEYETAKTQALSNALTFVNRALFAYWYDNPEYFWFDMNKMGYYWSWYPDSAYNSQNGTFTLYISIRPYSNAGYTNYYPDGYSTQEEVENDWNAMVECKDSLISNMDNTGSDFEKIKYFNDWLCDNNTYNETTQVTRMRYIITGAMLYGSTDEKEKYPVCQSYSFALKYLCDEANIPCTVTTSSSHMWNLIKLDGKWYAVDTTWNDNYKDAYIAKNVKDTNLACYNWLAIGSNRINSIDQNSAHLKEVQLDFDTLDPTTNTLLENLGMVSYAKADTNNDYTVSRADIAVLLKDANGEYTVTKDVNNDGSIDLRDSVSLSHLLLK